jgi:5-deoxy-glucuronate isomerase
VPLSGSCVGGPATARPHELDRPGTGCSRARHRLRLRPGGTRQVTVASDGRRPVRALRRPRRAARCPFRYGPPRTCRWSCAAPGRAVAAGATTSACGRGVRGRRRLICRRGGDARAATGRRYPAHKHDEATAQGECGARGGLLLRGRPRPGRAARPRVPARVELPRTRDRRLRRGPRPRHRAHPLGLARAVDAAAPGHDLYYLNVMAGPGAERAWRICDHPDQAWVRDTWAEQAVDPRRTGHGGH